MSWLKLLWKSIASIAILAILWNNLDMHYLWAMLSNIDIMFVLLASFIFIFSQFISAQRYLFVMRALNRRIPFALSAQVHFVGLWFNQLLPGGVGGDIFKVLSLKKKIGLSRAARCAFLDRFSGLVMLMLSVFLLLPWYENVIGNADLLVTLFVLVIVFFVGIAMAIFLSCNRNFRRILPKYLRYIALMFIDILRFRKIHHMINQFWTSIIIHISGVLVYLLIGLSLGVDLNPLEYFLLVPLIFLIALMPISFAGWGVRESGAIFLFGLVGVTPEYSFAMSVIFGIILVCAGFPGGIMLYFIKKNIH